MKDYYSHDMKINANNLEDVVMEDLINHEAKKITNSYQKGRTRNHHKIISRKKQTSTQINLLMIRVSVSTKSPRLDKQYVWEVAAGSSSYVIREETDPAKQISCGTEITLYLKVEEEEEPKEGEETQQEGEKKKNKTNTKKYWDWKLANETKPIWIRDKRAIKDDLEKVAIPVMHDNQVVGKKYAR
nr:heat shock protein 90-5, chloroplastic [Tanacetum cinerariifolium]